MKPTHRRRGDTQNNTPCNTGDADLKSVEVELKRRVNAVVGREGHPTRCFVPKIVSMPTPIGYFRAGEELMRKIANQK